MQRVAAEAELEVRVLSAPAAAAENAPTQSSAARVGQRVWVVLVPADPPLHQAEVLAGALVQTKAAMWVVGIVLGLFVGPNQSASRSLLGRFVPQEKETEFFGFFAFSGKATAFLGPWIYAQAIILTGNARYGIFAVFLLFVIGGSILQTVDEEAGMRGATEAA